MMWKPVQIFIPLIVISCVSGKARLDDDDDDGDAVNNAEDVTEACEDGDPEVLTFTVTFEATEPGCDWGENDNLDPEQGVFAARNEQRVSLDIPSNVVICDATFDFQGINPDIDQLLVYDDNFLLTFNDIVLAASYAPMIDNFEQDESLAFYDWSQLVGTEVIFDNTIPTYCIGEDEGLAECVIPPPETVGTISLEFDPSLVAELSYRALEDDRYDFGFVALGDNDDTDCYHEEFSFLVEVPVIEVSGGALPGG